MTDRGVSLFSPPGGEVEAFQSVLDAARAGAGWAWSRLVGELDAPLRGYLRRQGVEDPDNLAGETWLHVARGIHAFDGEATSFRSWVFMIAHHRVIDDRRRRRRRPASAEEPEVLDRMGAVSASAEAEAMETAEVDDVMDVLGELSAAQREVVLLRVMGGFGISEIAEIVGKKPGACQALQRRAFRRLEKILSKGVRLEGSSSVTGLR